MKIVFLTSYYQPFLGTIYKRFPEFASWPFQKMMDVLLDQFFADTGAAHAHAIKHGNEAFLIISNCEPLQKKWALENDVKYSEANWQEEIAFAQVKFFKPDVFYLESIFNFFGPFVNAVQPYCKTVISWISTPFTKELDLNGIDLVVSSTPAFVEEFRNMGVNSEYMLPAFDTRVLSRINKKSEKTVPFSFVGGVSYEHIDRRKAIETLVKKTPIQLWGYGFEALYGKKTYRKRSRAYYRELFNRLKGPSPVLKAYRGEAWGLDMYQALQDSLITFNMHEAYALKGKVGNMRMFEGTGMATLVLNDYGTNLADLFVPGKEIEVYHSIEEAIEKVKYYTNNPAKAIEIGLNGQKRTVRDYNYDIWIMALEAFSKKCLAQSRTI